MSNRREFLQMSLAASALPAIAAARPENAAPSSDQDVGRGHVIVEAMSPMARAFGEEAVRLGLEPHAIKDDITDLWCHTLDLHWKRRPVPLAGITLSTSLFCLETLARDYGMRVWFKAIHDSLPGGGLKHSLAGHNTLVRQAAAFGGPWSVGFAKWLPIFRRSIRANGSRKLWNRPGEPGSLAQWFPGSSHPGPGFKPIWFLKGATYGTSSRRQRQGIR